jgi:hypothetical protein
VSNLPSTLELLRRVFLLALLGLVAVVLVGPVIALVSVALSLVLVVLPFAVIGFVVWTLVQIAVGGKHLAWHNLREQGRALQETVRQIVRLSAQVLHAPLRLVKAIGLRAGDVAGGVWQLAKSGTRLVGEILVITATGFLVGGGVDLVFGPAKQDPGLPVPLNALLGGALGCLAGVAMIVLEKRAQSRREKFRSLVISH